MMNNTKIVATMGPACLTKDTLTQMIKAGVNVCRLNFSHADHKTHLETIHLIKEINQDLNVHTAILADLQGPKIRIGKIEEGSSLVDGTEFVITTKECVGDSTKAYINYEQFPEDVKAGELILINDGKLHIEVVSTNSKDTVITKVIHGGELSSNKGVNLPNTVISQPCLTEKDLKDLDFILTQPIEWIGLSFVRSAQDILELKKHIKKENHSARVIAKIEKPQAIKNLNSIIDVTDAVMIARGDLGVEIPMQKVPVIQKKIAKMCLEKAKPVIVATQMLESMTESVTPTRAEVNDVANAVLDGADAVMLSGETSVGKNPVQVIKTMDTIVREMESFEGIYNKEELPQRNQSRFITDSICFNACRLGRRVKAHAILTMSFSGYTGYKIASMRPDSDIFVFTSNRKILTQLSLVWGVRAHYYDKTVSTDHTIADIKYLLKKEGLVKDGDLVINIASMPIESHGNSNMLKLSYVE